jgi:threonine dehydratase
MKNLQDDAESLLRRASNAQARLRRYFTPTRLLCASSLGRGTNAQVYLKLESELPTGSFKVRGALYALNAEMGRRTLPEVVASSTGNHGAAVAYAGKILNVPVTIFLPHNSNPTKQRRIREQGAEIVEHGKDISEAFDAANAYANRTGAFLLSDASNSDVPIGTATIAIEIVERLPDVDEIWVPIGDTALIRGVAAVAKHLRPGVRVIGVQAERAPAYYLSWKRGGVVTTKSCDTIADGLATRIPIQENVTAIRKLVDDVNLVTEVQLLSAVEHLYVNERIVAEPAGAATTAAWLATSRRTPNAPVILLVTGSNIADPAQWSGRKIFQNSETAFSRLTESNKIGGTKNAGVIGG